MRWVWALIALSLPARLFLMQRSIWLDEAWVANSILEPAWRDMFYYPWFAQSTPPGFLFLVRLTGASGDFALRLIPLAASVASCWLLARALLVKVGETAAIAAAGALACNYAAILYGTRLKQYSVDMFVACLFLHAIASPPPRWARIALCTLAPFVSFTAVFFLPAIVWRGGAINALATAAAFAVNYFVFIVPNKSELFNNSWLGKFLDPAHPIDTLVRFFWSAGTLFLPVNSPYGWTIVALAIVASMIGAWLVRRQGLTVAYAAPILVAIAMSFAGFYPLLDTPRIILWMLPCIALGLGAVAEKLPKWAVVVAAALAVAGMQYIYFTRPPAVEENCSAVASLVGVDALYVHAATREQFDYYRRFHDFSKTKIVYGKTSYPCCMLRVNERATYPDVRGFENEMLAAISDHKRLWIYSPSGAEGHFGAFMREHLAKLPSLRAGCRVAESRDFDQVRTTLLVCE